MANEFGVPINNAFFLDKLYSARQDCLSASKELTKLWGDCLNAYYNIAVEIVAYEQGNMTESDFILRSQQVIPELNAYIKSISEYPNLLS